MVVTMTVIVMALTAMAAAELWMFWQLGERDERRRTRMRVQGNADDAQQLVKRHRRSTTDMRRLSLTTTGRREPSPG